jgi:hypothetical protein
MTAAAAKETVQVPIEVWNQISRRAQVVARRQLPTYDYEKVFWNSTFTIGLVGLSWAAVKLGIVIRSVGQSMQDVGALFTDPAGTINREFFFYLYDWCDPNGVHFSDPPPIFNPVSSFFSFNIMTGGFGLGTATYDAVRVAAVNKYRADPALWAAYKAKFQAQYPDVNMPEDDAEHKFEPSDILDAANRFFDNYGSLVPIGAVMAHMSLEAARVKGLQHRLKKELEQQ